VTGKWLTGQQYRQLNGSSTAGTSGGQSQVIYLQAAMSKVANSP